MNCELVLSSFLFYFHANHPPTGFRAALVSLCTQHLPCVQEQARGGIFPSCSPTTTFLACKRKSKVVLFANAGDILLHPAVLLHRHLPTCKTKLQACHSTILGSSMNSQIVCKLVPSFFFVIFVVIAFLQVSLLIYHLLICKQLLPHGPPFERSIWVCFSLSNRDCI